jgi:hypothetical protein
MNSISMNSLFHSSFLSDSIMINNTRASAALPPIPILKDESGLKEWEVMLRLHLKFFAIEHWLGGVPPIQRNQAIAHRLIVEQITAYAMIRGTIGPIMPRLEFAGYVDHNQIPSTLFGYVKRVMTPVLDHVSVNGLQQPADQHFESLMDCLNHMASTASIVRYVDSNRRLKDIGEELEIITGFVDSRYHAAIGVLAGSIEEDQVSREKIVRGLYQIAYNERNGFPLVSHLNVNGTH